MAFPTGEQIDIIATQILFDAKQAILSLKAWNNSITEGATKLKLFKELIRSTAQQMNGDLKGATSAVTRFAKALDVNPAAVRGVGKDLQDAAKAGESMGQRTENALGRVFTSVNALRIALGAIVSMLLFQVIQAVNQVVGDSIKQFTELEDSLWRIVVAEKALSEQGQEISVEGLKKGIEDIRKLMPIFSEQDIAGLVGKVSISTKELGYTEQQILDLAKSISILNVVSTENEDLNATAQKVITALLSGTTKGVSGLGVQLNDTVIKTKAVELGFIKASDSIDDLTKKEKDFAKLQIVLETSAGSLGLLNEYLDTNSAKLRTNSAAWDDLKTAIGGFTSTIIPALSGILEMLTDAVNLLKAVYVILEVAEASLNRFFSSLSVGANAIEAIKGTLRDIPSIFDAIAKEQIPNLFAKMPANAPKWFKDLFGDYLKDVETATDLTAKFNDEAADNGDAQKALDELDQKLKDIIIDAQQAQEDLDIKFNQKLADLDIEYNRKAEDAARDHQQKLEDINQDAIDKAEDARRKAREREWQAEQELLQKLKELRERFLLDLEDALHARDARQVLRLIKEYKLEKQNIIDRAALDKKQRAESLREELRQIEIERQRRIESENIEYQRKLADLNVAKARERADLDVWYKREQEDIARNLEQKIQRLLAGYISEETLHKEHQKAIYDILSYYFGKDTDLMGRLTQFMADQFAQVQQLAAATAQTISMMGSLGGGDWRRRKHTASWWSRGGSRARNLCWTRCLFAVRRGRRGCSHASN